MQVSRFYIVFIFSFCSLTAFAQKKYTLKIINTDSKSKIFSKINYRKTHSDSLKVFNELDNVIVALHSKSYLTASYDSVKQNGKNIKAYLSIGRSFTWATLKKGNLSPEIIRKVDFKEKIYRNKPFNYQEVSKIETKILDYAENSGYPFASITLKNITTSPNSIEASFHFVPGIKITFDSIGVIGDALINRKFLSNYVQIKKGEPYSQHKIDNIKPLLQKLNIAIIKREPEIRFINGQAYVYLFLDNKKTTGIDGIAGLQQDPLDQDKLLITGEFNLNLRNIMQSGKQAQLHWKKLSRESSSLESSYAQPALFSSPLELNMSFNFLDQDTTYISLNPKIGFKYNLIKYGTIGFFYESVTTKLLDTSQFRNATVLPPFSDAKTNSYGVSYEWNNLDNYYLPHKGLKIEIESAAGNKKINQVLAPELYNEIKINSLQIQGIGKIENHISLHQTFTFVQRITGAWVNNEKLFLNDLYRLGGINSIRGFREQSFFASRYLIETAELRIFTEEDSYFMLFADYSQYITEVDNVWEENYPLGFGGGLSFSTKAGIFNMVYALGKEKGGQVNFNNSVVNFGLVSRF